MHHTRAQRGPYRNVDTLDEVLAPELIAQATEISLEMMHAQERLQAHDRHATLAQLPPYLRDAFIVLAVAMVGLDSLPPGVLLMCVMIPHERAIVAPHQDDVPG